MVEINVYRLHDYTAPSGMFDESDFKRMNEKIGANQVLSRIQNGGFFTL